MPSCMSWPVHIMTQALLNSEKEVKDTVAKDYDRAFTYRRSPKRKKKQEKKKQQMPGTILSERANKQITLSWTHIFNFSRQYIVIKSRWDIFRSTVVLVICLSAHRCQWTQKRNETWQHSCVERHQTSGEILLSGWFWYGSIRGGTNGSRYKVVNKQLWLKEISI